MKQKIFKIFATLGPIGYAYAPGTTASAVVLIIAYLAGFSILSSTTQLFIIMGMLTLALGITYKALNSFKVSDPSQIVIDELMGSLMTLFMLPQSIMVYICAFILFRIFDIFKPLGIKKFERLPSAYGVVLDDVFAGMLANIILRIVLRFVDPTLIIIF